jgi:hypothetical protein
MVISRWRRIWYASNLAEIKCGNASLDRARLRGVRHIDDVDDSFEAE